MNLMISTYSVSGAFRKKLADKFGPDCMFLTLSELKAAGLTGLMKLVIRTNPRDVFVIYEDESSKYVIPTLKIIGSFFRANRYFLLTSNLDVAAFSRFSAVLTVFSIVKVNLTARLRALASYVELLYFARAERVVPWKALASSVLYLKGNLWFGVKAGGSVGHIAGVINSLLRSGYSVHFFGFEWPVGVDQSLRYEHVKTPKVLAYPSDLNGIIYAHELYRISAKANQNEGFIYQRLTTNNYAGVKLSRKRGQFLVLEYNGSEVWVAKNWGVGLQFPRISSLCERVCLSHAHLIVTVSEVLRQELLERGVENERIVVYPNCIDETIFAPERYSEQETQNLRSSLGLTQDNLVITFVGTFGKWHGVDFLARTIVHLVSHEREWLDKSKIKFLIVGDGLLMNDVRRILDKPSVSEYVLMPGLIEQNLAPLYLAASDILVSPHVENVDGTKFFGSPTKLFEYMAMSKAIVAANLEQIGQVLAPSNGRQLALLYEPGNQREFVEKIKLASESSELRTELGNNAREEAMTKFRWTHHTNAILKKLFTVAERYHEQA